MDVRNPSLENDPSLQMVGHDLSADEAACLQAVILALRSLRYGSVNLTVHDGRLVEIQKVEKIRMNGSNVMF